MKSGKYVLAGIASVMLLSAAVIPSYAQQADNKAVVAPMRGPMDTVFKVFDTNADGKITRDEVNAEKAKIFAEIDKNGDKKLSYDEVKAWSKDFLSKLPGPQAEPDQPPPSPAGDDQANGDQNPPPPPDNQPGASEQMGGSSGIGMPGMMRHDWQGRRDMDRGRDHGMSHHHGGLREAIAQMFLRADANDNGFISQDEFNVMADQVFTHMDRNDDGVLDQKDRPPMHRGWGQGRMNGHFGHGPMRNR